MTMGMADAIKLIESIGGRAKQPARSTALAVYQHRANDKAFTGALVRIRQAGIQVIVARSLEAFEG